MEAVHSAIGLVALAGLAWVLGERRGRASPRAAAVGLIVQIALALVLLKLPPAKAAFLLLNDAILALQRATGEGTAFVFGYLGGGAPPFEESHAGATFILAFQALPLILVVSALSALLFHWRVLPLAVRGLSWALRRTLGIGGALGLGAGANVFVGMIEAPLLIRPYLQALSRSELFALMTCGMATVAGTVMVLYASILAPVIPDALGHVLAASLISAPAAITVAHLMVPPDGPPTEGKLALEPAGSAMDAITRGTGEGVKLVINVAAMLVVLVALVALANEALALLPDLGGAPITLQRVFGYAFAPLVWAMGVPWAEAEAAGALMGTKTVLNELIAYLDMAALPEGTLGPRARLIMTYAMCGFANFGSLGIMIGGLATMAPERRGEIVRLGLRSIVAGTLATAMTGAVVGIVL